MKLQRKPLLRRLTALTLAVLTAVTAAAPAMAEPMGDQVEPTYDEAYYATLDYYGNLTEGSVVKSYTLNGADTLTDYGVYDEVVNLTDGTSPVQSASSTVFRFDRNAAPKHFYFEGKTTKPFETLPWTIGISYTLNGVPARAEDLAGKTGVVEIKLDILPNPAASAYARNNYTLEAMAVFNQDDILSLEAEGAQVQLVGNLRAVLFVVLPGEEQHFTIRVGSEDFSFGGMTFLMVPATLEQLKEIAKLSQRKDELEEDYNKLSGSLDALLDSMGDLGDSLRDTASGLDQLDQARDTFSSGKDQLYTDGDKVRDDLTALEESLGLMPGHLGDADDAVVDLTDSLKDVTDAALKLKGDLDDVDGCLDDLRNDLRRIRTNGSATESDLNAVGRDLDKLRDSLREAAGTLEILDIRINGGILKKIDGETGKFITIQKKQLGEVLKNVDDLNAAWTAAGGTEAKDSTIAYSAFQAAALIAAGAANNPAAAGELLSQVAAVDKGIADVQAAMPGTTAEDALQFLVTSGKIDNAAAQKYQQAKPQLVLMEQIYTTICGGTDRPMTKANFFTAMLMLSEIKEVNADPQLTAEQKQAKITAILQNKSSYARTGKLLSELNGDHDTQAVTGMLTDLAVLLGHMGSGGLTGSLGGLLNSVGGAMGSLGDTTKVGQDLITTVNSLLDEVKDMDDTLNDHVPGLRETLQDTRNLVGDLSLTVGDTNTFLGSFRSLAKDTGGQLDAGTRATLRNLADTLRRTARSTDSVGDVKSAKDALTSIIEDTWDEYTGDINNLLLMDAGAQAQSLTSQQNPAPSSIQILIRTQEIKAEEPTAETLAQESAAPTTFWGRIAQMFRDFWSAITGIFHKK